MDRRAHIAAAPPSPWWAPSREPATSSYHHQTRERCLQCLLQHLVLGCIAAVGAIAAREPVSVRSAAAVTEAVARNWASSYQNSIFTRRGSAVSDMAAETPKTNGGNSVAVRRVAAHGHPGAVPVSRLQRCGDNPSTPRGDSAAPNATAAPSRATVHVAPRIDGACEAKGRRSVRVPGPSFVCACGSACACV